ncbi:MAG: hypothetical protein JWP97_3603 [Labilithrix sp.]|nr:hypothetical protein [Labilithrix sp.]
MRSLPLLALLSATALACGDAAPAAKNPEAPPSDAAPALTAAVAPVTTTSLHRSGVKRTIARGLGYFLQEVSVEDYPVMSNGKFRGFKIKEITGEWGVDLRPGDVVMRVNGMSIEHPEDADAALRSLEKAKALRVDYERDGKPRVLELPITDD